MESDLLDIVHLIWELTQQVIHLQDTQPLASQDFRYILSIIVSWCLPQSEFMTFLLTH
jgi:hypothetical protein